MTAQRWQAWCRKMRSRTPWTKAGVVHDSRAGALNFISDTELLGGVDLDLEWSVQPEGEMPQLEKTDRYQLRMMRPQG